MTSQMPPSPLIAASELDLSAPDQVVIDCRHDLADPEAGRTAFAAGHIPGARMAHLDEDLSGPKTAADGTFRGRHPLPALADFVATMRRLGVNDTTRIIAVDAHGGMFAARLWWMLRWAGHARVAVLDGGLAAWTTAGGELVGGTDRPPSASGNFSARPSLTSTVDVDQVMANLASGALTIVDARAPDRFRGENETLDRVGGHIPGAINRFFKDNLLPDGRFKPADQLRTEFETLLGASVNAPGACVMQCGSGVTACHNLLAMDVAGLSGAALYPGSWSEWSASSARPVATGIAGH